MYEYIRKLPSVFRLTYSGETTAITVDRILRKMEKDDNSRKLILRKIEGVIRDIVRDIGSNVPPLLSYPNTSAWQDVSFTADCGLEVRRNRRMTSIRFESIQSVKKFGLMLKVLSIMYRLIKTSHFSTKRDIYYQDPDLFGSQHTLDMIVDNLSCMLGVPRWNLHILATSKGCVAGDLVFQDVDNNHISCRHTQMGIQVPNHVMGIHHISTSASFILVVEKDATFQKLLDVKFCEKMHPCIVVTGKGFPDMNTRLLVKKLWESFHIPTLALMDADPHGIEIMAVYKFGSKALSFESKHLSLPSLKWIGLLPSDIQRLGVPEAALIPLSTADTDKARDLLSRPYMQALPQWKHEVEVLLGSQKKAELQSLDAISPAFLVDVYLPSKLRCSGWL